VAVTQFSLSDEERVRQFTGQRSALTIQITHSTASEPVFSFYHLDPLAANSQLQSKTKIDGQREESLQQKGKLIFYAKE